MKTIYRLKLQEPKQVKKTEQITNDKGEKIEQSKFVEELVPRTFVLKRPNRSELEDLDIFRSITESDYIRRGVLSVNILSKKLVDEGGILSKDEQEEYRKLTEKFIEKQPEYLKLNNISEKDRTEEQTKNYEELLKELTEVMGQIQDFDNKSNNLLIGRQNFFRVIKVHYISCSCNLWRKRMENLPQFLKVKHLMKRIYMSIRCLTRTTASLLLLRF